MTSAKGTVPMNNSPHFVDNHIVLVYQKPLVICNPRWIPGVLCTPVCVIASLFFGGGQDEK